MARNTVVKQGMLVVSALALGALAGCDRPGPAESAGRQVDKTVDKVATQADRATDPARGGAERAGAALDDAAITAAVKANLLAEPGLKVLQINVDTNDGKVVLSGSTNSADSKRKAEQIASAVQGVKSVENRLSVTS